MPPEALPEEPELRPAVTLVEPANPTEPPLPPLVPEGSSLSLEPPHAARAARTHEMLAGQARRRASERGVRGLLERVANISTRWRQSRKFLIARWQDCQS
jgi:hypothetical protein